MQLFTHLLSSYLQGMGDFFSALPIGAFGISIDIAKIRLLHDNVSCFDEKFIGIKQNTSIAH